MLEISIKFNKEDHPDLWDKMSGATLMSKSNNFPLNIMGKGFEAIPVMVSKSNPLMICECILTIKE